jgi:type IV pilus assembly protein PilW
MSMIELLVGLAIGSLVIIGAVFVYSQSRTTYAINETVARLQENGRYALAVLEPDLQLAGNYGFVNDPGLVNYVIGTTPTPTWNLDANDTQLTGVPAGVHVCGDNFGINLWLPVEGSNDSYGLPTACNPTTGTYVTGSDRLTIRRASTRVETGPTAQRVQIYADRLNMPAQRMFSNGSATYTLDANHQIRNLLVRSYFLTDRSGTSNAAISTLWRKSLGVDGSGNSAMIDEEILPGVEDFQVMFAVDTGDHDGVTGFDVNDDSEPLVPDMTNGVMARWVAPGNAIFGPPPGGMRAQVVAVRVWLLLRAENPEVGFTDSATYTYAGKTYDPPAAVEGFRRTLMSRTIFLRNARYF